MTRHRRSKRALGRKVLKGFEIALCVGVLAAFAYTFLEYAEGSTDFHVQTVEIYGLRYLDEAEVLRQSGISSGGNVIFFGAEAVQERVEAMPYVRSCRVALVFPHTVALHLVEREPAASLMVNSRTYAIDAEGVVLREYGPLEMPLAPFITNVPGAAFVEEGDRLTQPALL